MTDPCEYIILYFGINSSISLLFLQKHRCRRYASSFEEFLSKDHEKSMHMLEKAEREAKLTEEISARRSELARQFGQSRLDIYVWEENWRLVKMCQMFLYRVSPVAWRAKYDWSESERSIVLADAPSTDLFGRYKTLDEGASLENLIGNLGKDILRFTLSKSSSLNARTIVSRFVELFEQDVLGAGPVELYFEDPFDLIRIFRAMETQNLNALIHLESLAAPMADMAVTITVTEAQVKREISEITSTINDLEVRTG